MLDGAEYKARGQWAAGERLEEGSIAGRGRFGGGESRFQQGPQGGLAAGVCRVLQTCWQPGLSTAAEAEPQAPILPPRRPRRQPAPARELAACQQATAAPGIGATSAAAAAGLRGVCSRHGPGRTSISVSMPVGTSSICESLPPPGMVELEWQREGSVASESPPHLTVGLSPRSLLLCLVPAVTHQTHKTFLLCTDVIRNHGRCSWGQTRVLRRVRGGAAVGRGLLVARPGQYTPPAGAAA